jgi:hypothetical protein
VEEEVDEDLEGIDQVEVDFEEGILEEVEAFEEEVDEGEVLVVVLAMEQHQVEMEVHVLVIEMEQQHLRETVEVDLEQKDDLDQKAEIE